MHLQTDRQTDSTASGTAVYTHCHTQCCLYGQTWTQTQPNITYNSSFKLSLYFHVTYCYITDDDVSVLVAVDSVLTGGSCNNKEEEN